MFVYNGVQEYNFGDDDTSSRTLYGIQWASENLLQTDRKNLFESKKATVEQSNPSQISRCMHMMCTVVSVINEMNAGEELQDRRPNVSHESLRQMAEY